MRWDVQSQKVDEWVTHKEGTRWPCPECGVMTSLYDQAPKRTCRHQDSCQFKTLLDARPLRINCREHGVRQVHLSWVEENSRVTLLFEQLAIDVLRESDILGVTRILRISWDEAWHIMERMVNRGKYL